MTEKDRTTDPTMAGPTQPDPAGGWGPLATLRREMDRLFDDFGASRWPVPGAMRLMAEMPPVPAMDLVEGEEGYEITVELPGIDMKDVDLKVSGDILSLRGEKREASDRSEKGRHVSERRYGSFQRSLRLPPDADTGGIAASSANGILRITLPKSATARSRERKIEISGG